jgi:hypothetical protein
MTSGCTLHETFAIVVARRNTTPVEVRGPKESNTMVIRFPVDGEAKVDVADYMRTSCARVKRLYQLPTHNTFFHFDGICAGKEPGQRQACSYRVKIIGIMKARRSDRRARQIKCANRIAVRAGCVKKCEHACNITHVACVFCWGLIVKDSGPTTTCGLHLADHKRKKTCRGSGPCLIQ